MTDEKETIREILIEALQRISDEHGVRVEQVQVNWALSTHHRPSGGKVITIEVEATL